MIHHLRPRHLPFRRNWPANKNPQLTNTTSLPLQIPKPNETEGLGVGWPAQATDMEKLKALHEELKSKM